MSELTHEDEFLTHLTQAGMLAARLARIASGGSPNESADVKALRQAGYSETTPFDDHLRGELGEQRWVWYAADPARLVCAAAMTDAARAGYHMPTLISKACRQRAWENDRHSPAESIARVLYYRIKRETTTPAARWNATNAPYQRPADPGRTGNGDSPQSPPSARARRQPATAPSSAPVPRTPWDDHLRQLLGDKRWHEYAADERRRDVAARITQAAADGHDVDALLTKAVKARDWEDDARSPSRRVAGVLNYRVKRLIASGKFKPSGQDGQLPSQVARAVGRSTAPAQQSQGDSPPPPADQAAPRPRTAQPQQPDRSRG